jgi:hypothetical protein
VTAFNYVYFENLVVVAMDSLALSGDDGSPLAFWSKLFPLPHLRGVMCTTGIMQIGLDWFVEIQSRVMCNGVVYLDSIAPKALRTIAQKYPTSRTTTVYHFGYDPDARRFRGFAYRGTNNFASEELRMGFAVKPGTVDLSERFTNAAVERGAIPAIIEAVTQQKADDELLPPMLRVGVGGEVHVLTLTADDLFMWTCHRFDDYDSSYNAMLQRLRQQNAAEQ